MAWPKKLTNEEKLAQGAEYRQFIIDQEFSTSTFLRKMLTKYNHSFLEVKSYWENREKTWKTRGILVRDKSPDPYLRMPEFVKCFDRQHGICANPHCRLTFLGVDDPLAHADHCHRTRWFRGILCGDCNILEGKLRLKRREAEMHENEKKWFDAWSMPVGDQLKTN